MELGAGRRGKLGERPLGGGERRLGQGLHVVPEARGGRPVEEVPGVLDAARDRPVLALLELDGKIELGGAIVAPDQPRLEPRQAGRGRRRTEGERRLHQGRARRIALRRQLLDQAGEGELLVALGLGYVPAGAADELAERRRARPVEAQRQGVDEEADQPFDLAAAAVGDRGADHRIQAAGPPSEDLAHQRQQGREQGAAGLSGQAPEPLRRPGGERHGQEVAAAAPDRRPDPVPGELERLDALEAPAPEGEVSLPQLAGEPAALPGGVVAVGHGQLRQPRRSPRERRPVEGAQVEEQPVDRPAVGDDVVEGREQEVPARADPDHAEARERAPPQVEGARRLGPGEPGEGALGGRFPEAGEVDDRRVDRRRRLDLLHRFTGGVGDPRAQRLVPRHDAGEGGAQGHQVELADELHRARHIVERRAGLVPVEEPEPLLRGRQRCRTGLGRTPGDPGIGDGGAAALQPPDQLVELVAREVGWRGRGLGHRTSFSVLGPPEPGGPRRYRLASRPIPRRVRRSGRGGWAAAVTARLTCSNLECRNLRKSDRNGRSRSARLSRRRGSPPPRPRRPAPPAPRRSPGPGR